METTKIAPKFHLITYGCQMNKNDSERLEGLLGGLGFASTDQEEDADVIILNTCSVRQSAEDRVYGKMKDFGKLKERRPGVIVAVTGCMPGRDKEKKFQDRMDPVDLYFPTPQMVNLPKWIAELRPDLVNSPDLLDDYLKLHPVRAPSAQAFVTIQTGCNKFCTYCVVPHARGLEKNRPLKDILDEVRGLVEHGVVEITLLGQTVNSYVAPDPASFSSLNPYIPRDPQTAQKPAEYHYAALLWEVNQFPELRRLHWTAAHPRSMSDACIDALTLPKQVNYLHLPVQSGSTAVLQRMNRKYTREQYLEVIDKVKAKRPGIAIGTDIIVGFSGETTEQFEETVSMYQYCDFDISYTAQYSPRSGTLAEKLHADDVTRIEKRRRWDVLQELMEATTLRKNKTYVGKETTILVDRWKDGQAIGNTHEMKFASFPAEEASIIGKIVPVKVAMAQAWQLLCLKISAGGPGPNIPPPGGTEGGLG